MTTPCKRCLLSETDESAVYESVQQAIQNMPPYDKAPPPEYERRLELCKVCEHLVSGLCMRCGCYVELRAAAKKSRCPDKKHYW